MFVIKAFNKNGVRHTYLCDSYTVDLNSNSIGMHTDRAAQTVNINVGSLITNVYVENPQGKPIDLFYIKKGSMKALSLLSIN